MASRRHPPRASRTEAAARADRRPVPPVVEVPPGGLGRRAALLAGAGGLASLLAACATGGNPSGTASGASTTPGPSPTPGGSPSTSTAPPSGSPTGSATQSPSPLETGDRTRVRMALEKTEAMLAGLAGLPARRRRRPDLRRLADLHTAHRAELLTVLEEPDRPLPAAPEPPLTASEIPLREAGLQAELVSAALAAEDGLVARLLAAMSAGVAQWLATLPTPPARNDGAAPSTSPSPTEAAA